MSEDNQPRKYNNGLIFSDLYNANVFVELFKDKVKWSKDLGGWFVFNGRYWQKDSNDNIKNHAIETYYEIARRMKEFNTDIAYQHSKRSAGNSALNAMLDCVKPLLSSDVNEFDKDDYLFNCQNGTLDLSSDSFSNHNTKHLLTKISRVIYNLHAKADLWVKFLNEIFLGDKETINFMQRVMGYSMTSSTREQCMFILYGHGRNGKSRFIETIADIMGDYAINCPSSTFVLKQNPGIPNDVARLKGTRFASASETNHNVNMDEELIKQLTGNKYVTARFLNKEFFDFRSTFKIFLATNHKPNIRGTDTGIWRRIQMIPFELNITEEQEDRELGEKLLKESSGILNWMIEGYSKYCEIGLAVPDKIKKATQVYREEEDDLGSFIKDHCIIEKNPDATIATADFKDRFKQVMGYYKGGKAISEYMARLGHLPAGDNRIYINGKQQRAYVRIRWARDIDHINQEKEQIQW